MQFYRLLFLLCVGLFFNNASYANGTSCPSVDPTVTSTGCMINGQIWGEDALEAMHSKYDTSTLYYVAGCQTRYAPTNACMIAYKSNGTPVNVTVYCGQKSTCPTNYTLVGGSCKATSLTDCGIPDTPPPPKNCTPPLVLDVATNTCVSGPPCQDTPQNTICTPYGTTCAGASTLIKDVALCAGSPGTPSTPSPGSPGSPGWLWF